MGFTEFCIRRPVFATVLSLVLLLAGLMSFSRLTILVVIAHSSSLPKP